MAGWMLSQGLDVLSFLLIANLLLAAGNFMEPSSIILILAPILFPIAISLGIGPIHFGIIMVVNREIGMCHPPVGLNLYVASGITKMGITELTVAAWPWLLTMLAFLVVVTYWPALDAVVPEVHRRDVMGGGAARRWPLIHAHNPAHDRSATSPQTPRALQRHPPAALRGEVQGA